MAAVLAQRFDAEGSPVGGEFQVSFNPNEDNSSPGLAVADDGAFVVVWAAPGFLPGSKIIVGGQYGADGGLISTFAPGGFSIDDSREPSVDLAADGSAVVVWDATSTLGNDVDGRSIQGRRHTANGDPIGDQFQINTYTTNDQENAVVGADAAGNFVVAWESVGADDADSRSILAQRFDTNGDALGDEFRVSISTLRDNLDPSIAVRGDGEFVIAWTAPGFVPPSTNLLGRRYAADGDLLETFQASAGTVGSERHPQVSFDTDGSFVVAWDSSFLDETDGDSRSIQARRFAADGSALGDQFQVNTFTPGDQIRASVAADDERFVIVWETEGTDGDGLGIQAQRYAVRVFADGFETGDLSAW